jgi:phage tail-like protein
MADRKDPLPAFCFKVTLTIDGFRDGKAYFKSVSGLKYETDVLDIKSGGVNHSVYRVPNGGKWPNLVLKRGFTGDDTIRVWRESWLKPSGPKTRATITIELLDTLHNPKSTHVFYEGWPCKLEYSESDAAKNEVLIETLEIAHHGPKFE